ncbi:MAG: hypothetical protein HQK79_05885 [Desulfobacterales bacterium]|nr:hypothetical protein [Desulfobacterales bacterium]MBF0396036.1 hypothetical protein [Desulfobacterales bacterium]
MSNYIKLRKCLLKILYENFKEYPYASMELKQLEEECNITPKELNWNIVYLEKCGYVELGKSSDCPPYIAAMATITAKGIDIVEKTEYEGEVNICL